MRGLVHAPRSLLYDPNPEPQSRQSKYEDAIKRVVNRLRAKQVPVAEKDVRGKRRQRKKNRTINTYMRGIELFSFWMQAKFGYELDPRNVTRNVAFEYLNWLRGADPPDVRSMIVRAWKGEDAYLLLETVERIARAQGEASVLQIYEALPTQSKPKYTVGGRPELQSLFSALNELVYSNSMLTRTPTAREIRKEFGSIWTSAEQDPNTYRYSISPRTAYAPASAATYLNALSVVWSEMTRGENVEGGEAPLLYNPWTGPGSPHNVVMADVHEARRRRKVEHVLTHPLVNAILEATEGFTLEARRDRLAVQLMLYTAIRAEELVGLQRRDLGVVDGILSIRVIGKGDKERIVPIFSDVKESLATMDALLKEKSNEKQWEDRKSKPTEMARYCLTLLTEKKAPLVPSLPRWGTNSKMESPETEALEPLDTSGLRGMLDKLAKAARVFDKQTGQTRPLSSQEKALIHPHALRHYAATAAHEAGLSLDEIKKLLGHSQLVTTEGYVHIEPRSSAQLGAYIAKARAGSVMSVEEAEALTRQRRSALEDPTIEAAPVERVAIAKRAKEPAPPTKPPKAPPTDIESPFWAYEPGAERRVGYLPVRGVGVGALPKSEVALANFRLGERSLLPWWAGRANRWKPDEMAPIVSFYQTFEDESELDLKAKFLDLFYTILQEQGVTAASAYSEWIREILGTASAQFLTVMLRRGDQWIEFDEPAQPGEAGVVRMHDGERILEWFKAHAAAESPILRTERVQKDRYPLLVAMSKLPEWFFADDPILELPPEERRQLRAWIEKLQGSKLSIRRLISKAHRLANMVNTWWQMRKELGSAKGLSEQSRESRYHDIAHVEKEIQDESTALFGVELELDTLVGTKGASAEKALEHLAPRLERLSLPGEEAIQIPTLAPVERRILLQLASKGVKMEPQQDFQVEEIIRDPTGMFSAERIRWNSQDTIEHTREFKRQFFQQRGTDSECVVRRTLRDLWERKKRKPGEKLHHDIVQRHMGALMAYLVPCPAELEKQLRELFDAIESPSQVPIPMRYTPQVLRDWWLRLTEEELDEMTGPELAMERSEKAKEMPKLVSLQEARKVAEGLQESTASGVRRNQAVVTQLRELVNPITLVFAEIWPV
ncbi:MAG: tyrosine-type recombinase/integrase [Planctomycetota bacterium]|jgi:integrase